MSEDNIIEIDLVVKPIRSKQVSIVDERQIDVVLSEVMGEDNIRCFEAIYGPPSSHTIANV